MDYIYENIPLDTKLNINLFLHRVKYVQDHWHDSLELFFVLKGSVDMFIQRKKYTLHEEDMILINSNEIHSIFADEDNLLLVLQIPVSFFADQFEPAEQMTFHLKSFMYGPEEQERFNEIRMLLAEMMRVYNKESYGYELKMKSLLFELMYLLIWKFKESGESSSDRMSPKHMERMLRITNYIQENYMKPLNLNELAAREYLSVPYLSNFFHKNMGQSFTKYMNEIRLNHAVKDIVYTDRSITRIAMDNGFPNLKSFHKAFKDVYNMTPNQYRKELHESKPAERIAGGGQKLSSYLEFDRENAYGALFKYLPSQNPGYTDKSADKGVVTQEIHLRWHESGKPLKPYWSKICTIGKAKEGLYQEVQAHLRSVQSMMKFEYIRFHGLFDDEMMVYREDAHGSPSFNFFYVDQLFDFLQEIGLKPYIEFGFMPSDLASGDNHIFYKKSNITKPKDLSKWTMLIRRFMMHCERRYGLEALKTWKYTCWNEPDLILFWKDPIEDYYELYAATYRAVKEFGPRLQFGGPEIISDTIHQEGWLESYFAFCRRENCLPDFFSFHSYPAGVLGEDEEVVWSPTSRSNDYLAETIKLLRKKLRQENMKPMEIFITEWNATGDHRDLTNDTAFKAAYIAKNVAENADEIAGLAYWALTDHLEELPPPTETFHGGLGLLTNNGIKKPGYYAYQLLSRLGSELHDRGSGYFATKRGDSYQLLLYHYCHFDKLYEQSESLGIDSHRRYHVFQDMNDLEMSFTCEGIPPGTYEMRSIQISREHGSAYDAWLAMGAPKELTPDLVEYLNQMAVPLQECKIVDISEPVAVFKHTLAPHEVRLYELKPVRYWPQEN